MRSQVPLEEGDRGLTQREEGDGEMEVEIGVMCHNAHECWQPPGAGRGKKFLL